MKEVTFEVSTTLLTTQELEEYREAKKENNKLPKPQWNLCIHYTAETSAELLDKLASMATDRGTVIRLQDDIRRATADEETGNEQDEAVKNWRASKLEASDDGKIHVDADEIYEGIFLEKKPRASKLTVEQRAERELAKMSAEQVAALLTKYTSN